MNQILTPLGYRNISDINVGDEVTAYDVFTGLPIINTVLEKSNWEFKDRLFYNKETKELDVEKSEYAYKKFFKINGNIDWNFFGLQSVWRNDNQVVHIKDLVVGDIVFNGNNEDVLITSIEENEDIKEWIRFEITGDHSFIENNFTLHNASRYWATTLGSSSNWNATANTSWSATSGGANNASVPTSADSIFLDANSNAVSTISANITVFSVDCNGFTGTLTHNSGITLTISGASGIFRLSAGMTYTRGSTTTSAIKFTATSGTNQITTNGKTIAKLIIEGDGSTQTLQDALTCSGAILQNAGTFNTNNQTVQCLYFQGYINGYVATLTLGSTVMTITGDDVSSGLYTFYLDVDSDNGVSYTVTANTAQIKFISTSNLQTYLVNINVTGDPSKIWRTGSGSGGFDFGAYTGTFTEIKDDGTVAHTFRFVNSQTITLTSAAGWAINGSAGQLVTITTFSSGTFTTISVASGTVTANYVSLKDNHATGGATFNATNSTNVSGNTGWTITAPVSSVNSGFFMLMNR